MVAQSADDQLATLLTTDQPMPSGSVAELWRYRYGVEVGPMLSLNNLAAVILLLAARKNNAFIRFTNGFKNIKEAIHLCIYAS